MGLGRSKLMKAFLGLAAIALMAAVGAGCQRGSQTMPNDPLVALLCDEGYILSPDGTACVPRESVIVHGVVTDEITGLPIEGVLVIVNPFDVAEEVRTNANGYFRVTGGPTTDDDIIVTYVHSDYLFFSQPLNDSQLAIDLPGDLPEAELPMEPDDEEDYGLIVLNGSAKLKYLGRTCRIAGAVYAGDLAADGATVVLWDNRGPNALQPSGGSSTPLPIEWHGNGHEVASTTTDGSGFFEFTNVRSSNRNDYEVWVLGYNDDATNGTGVTDYHMAREWLGDACLNADSINVTNMIFRLKPVSKAIMYTNFVPDPAAIFGDPSTSDDPDSGAPHVGITTSAWSGSDLVYSGLNFANASSTIVLHFGAEVAAPAATFDQTTGQIIISRYESYGVNPGYGTPLAYTATWSNDNTVLTIVMAAPFDPVDWDGETNFAMRINWLFWDDGGIYISADDSSNYLEFRFNLTTPPTLLASPQPQIYWNDPALGYESATGVDCDALACWLVDDENYFVSGYQDPWPPPPQAISPHFGDGSFRLWWNHVPGAFKYEIVFRRTATVDTPALYDVATSAYPLNHWFLLTGATITPTNINPNFDDVIVATNVFDALWETLAPYPLVADLKIDVGVIAFDRYDNFSLLTETSLLTLPGASATGLVDGRIASIQDATNTSGSASAEYGHSKLLGEVTLEFSEPMDPTVDLDLDEHGGMLVSIDTTDKNVTWDTANYASKSATIGSWSYRPRGACTPLICPSFDLDGDTGTTGDAVCVYDVSLFAASQNVYLVPVAGGVARDRLAVASIDAARQLVIFTDAIETSGTAAPIADPSGWFACVATADATHVVSMSSCAAAAGGGLEATVSDASIFHPGMEIFVMEHNATGPVSTVTRTTVTKVRTAATQIEVAACPTDMPAMVTHAPPWDTTNPVEYSFRNTTTIPALTQDVDASSGGVGLKLAHGTLPATVMVGDLCVVDIDADATTIADRYFGVVTAIDMPTTPAAPPSPDDTLTLSATGLPTGMPTIPNGTLYYTVQEPDCNPPAIVCLGDSFEVTGGEDTSGNVGLQSFADQFSFCTGGHGCDNFTTGVFIY